MMLARQSRIPFALLTLVAAISLLGCKSGSVATRTERVPERVVVVESGGPPPHAPAHGYRARHHYYYYPCSHVYYEPSRGIYWYLRSGSWEMGVSLPHSIDISAESHVSIKMDSDSPYVEFEAHRKAYPPGQMKKKGGPGKGKGKGKAKGRVRS